MPTWGWLLICVLLTLCGFWIGRRFRNDVEQVQCEYLVHQSERIRELQRERDAAVSAYAKGKAEWLEEKRVLQAEIATYGEPGYPDGLPKREEEPN